MSELLQGKVSGRDWDTLRRVGIDPGERERSGSFSLVDDVEVDARLRDSAIEMLPLSAALQKYPQIGRDYLWQLISPEKDEFTRLARQSKAVGYFIRIRKGHQAILPLQACFFIKGEGFRQSVHNIIVMEEGSSLNIINGCASSADVHAGLHVGITEVYQQRGSFLAYTMIHDWSEDMEVRPRSAMLLDEGARFVSNYISIKRSRITQMFPHCRLQGEGASAAFNSLIYAPANSLYDLGSRVELAGRGTRAEVVSRAISGGGQVIARGELVGAAPGCKAHLECSGILLKQEGSIKAIPVLEAQHPEVEMSHEAAVGRIAEEEVLYLMARGLEEKQAISLIVRGFLDTKILGLPSVLAAEVDKIIALLDKSL